ncbi:MAG: hypothetical protein RIC87_09205 [Kiloniellales bacterium]
MFRDRSLVPGQAVRLLALGLLAEEPRSYGDLAAEVRRVTGLLVGPSLDLLAPPLELLRIEGLAREAEGRLGLTDAGRGELRHLLEAPLRQGASDLRRLVVTLKIRFIRFLDGEQRALQMDALIEDAERELARLAALNESNKGSGDFEAWLELEQAQSRDRLAWLHKRAEALKN